MRIIPVSIGPTNIHVRIDHQSLFSIFASMTQNGESKVIRIRVNREDVGRLLIQAQVTTTGILKKIGTHQLVGWMTPHEPRAIEFEGTSGPVSLFQLRITMNDKDGCTDLEYGGAIGRNYWLLGWILTRFCAKPIADRALRRLLTEIKIHAEHQGAGLTILSEKCQHSNSSDQPSQTPVARK